MDNINSTYLEAKKIMWVEDDKFLSDILARKLTESGANLIHLNIGEQAPSLAEKEMPDLILLDILLPGMDGFTILEKLKSNPKTSSIPVILLSNLGQKSDIEKGKKLGAVKFLIKASMGLDEIVYEIKGVLS